MPTSVLGIKTADSSLGCDHWSVQLYTLSAMIQKQPCSPRDPCPQKQVQWPQFNSDPESDLWASSPAQLWSGKSPAYPRSLYQTCSTVTLEAGLQILDPYMDPEAALILSSSIFSPQYKDSPTCPGIYLITQHEPSHRPNKSHTCLHTL